MNASLPALKIGGGGTQVRSGRSRGWGGGDVSPIVSVCSHNVKPWFGVTSELYCAINSIIVVLKYRTLATNDIYSKIGSFHITEIYFEDSTVRSAVETKPAGLHSNNAIAAFLKCIVTGIVHSKYSGHNLKTLMVLCHIEAFFGYFF